MKVCDHHLSNLNYIDMIQEGDVSVLLLLLRTCAKGLNLVEATHVFLVEPILNPAEELQAVGRVHRIGQTRSVSTFEKFIAFTKY